MAYITGRYSRVIRRPRNSPVSAVFHPCLATITRIRPIIYEISEIRRKCDRFEQLVWMRMGELCDTAVDLFDGMGDG